MKIKQVLIKYGFLIVIIVIASFLRLYKVENNPPHLTPDEASLGYNAYSILKTGKDEYGNTFPVIFKSFGDYKPGLYIYTTVPTIAIFGLTEFAVRLPSVISGIAAVSILYLIILELFKDKKLALVTSFLLAINPWHIHFSRGAWEINLSLTLTLLGILFFLLSFRKKSLLFVSGISFALTFWAYQGAKLSTGIVIVLLLLIYWRELIKFRAKDVVLPIIVAFIICLPIILSLFTGKVGRLNVFSVFSYPRPKDYLQAFLDQGNEQVGSLNYYLHHSESYNFLRGVMGRYFNHFSGRFLFFEGDWQNPRHTAPNHGQFLVIDLVLLVSGCVSLVKKGWTKANKFTVIWLLLAPLSAALSRDQVHAVRSYNLLIPLIVVNSFGFIYIFTLLKDNFKLDWLRKSVALAFISAYFVNFIYFLDAYFVHLPKHNSAYWEYGYKQIVETVTPIQDKYDKINLQQSYAQPYIYFLFYQKYDPAKYQAQAKLKESEFGDVGQVERIDNIYFVPIDWSVNRGDKGSLVIGDQVRIPDIDSQDENQFKLIKRIDYLNGKTTAFKIIEVLK